MSHPKEVWFSFTINSLWRKKKAKEKDPICAQAEPLWGWLVSFAHQLQQTCSSPAEWKAASQDICQPNRGHKCLCGWYNLLSPSDWRECHRGTDSCQALFLSEAWDKGFIANLSWECRFQGPWACHCEKGGRPTGLAWKASLGQSKTSTANPRSHGYYGLLQGCS